MIRTQLWFTLAAGVLLVSLTAHASPQNSHRAALSGTVLGPDGKPAANAVVTYQSAGGDTPHVVHTDTHGRFLITKLRRDNYDLRASWHGMFSTWLTNVMLRSGQDRTITLRLHNGANLAETSDTDAR